MTRVLNRLAAVSAALLMCLAGASEARAQYDRGKWVISGNASYSMHESDNARLLVVDGIVGQGYNLSVSPAASYMVRDNLAIGVRGSYGRSLFNINAAELAVSDISLDIRDYYSLRHDWSAGIFARPYIPIGSSGRYAMFAEVFLGGKAGQAKVIDEHDGTMAGTWQKSHSWSFEVNPGLTAFLTDHTALEVSVGLLDFCTSSTDQVHNQVYTGSRSSFKSSFMVDVLSLNFGLAFYF